MLFFPIESLFHTCCIVLNQLAAHLCAGHHRFIIIITTLYSFEILHVSVFCELKCCIIRIDCGNFIQFEKSLWLLCKLYLVITHLPVARRETSVGSVLRITIHLNLRPLPLTATRKEFVNQKFYYVEFFRIKTPINIEKWHSGTSCQTQAGWHNDTFW